MIVSVFEVVWFKVVGLDCYLSPRCTYLIPNYTTLSSPIGRFSRDFMDKFFVKTLAATPNPQSVIWCALHQDYSATPVFGCLLSEERAGHVVVDALLKGDKGHFGPLEHVSITLSCANFPHSVIAQVTRHRIATFDVQSFRYTSINKDSKIEDVFYFRPPGQFQSREGSYTLKPGDYEITRKAFESSLQVYTALLENGIPGEVARSVLPHDYRQHFIVTVNARSLMHLLDMRHKPDAQLEIQEFARLVLIEFQKWMPQVAQWYVEKRLNKGRLAP